MPFSLDPVDYYRRMSGLGKDQSPGGMGPKFESGMARGYGKEFGGGAGSSELFDLSGGMDAGMDMSGTQSIMGSVGANNSMETQLGASALGAIGGLEAARIQAEAQQEALEAQGKIAAKNRGASTRNSIIGAVGGIAAAGIGAAI